MLVPVNTDYGPIQLAHPCLSTEQSVNAEPVIYQLRMATRSSDLYQLHVSAPVTQRALVDRVVKTLSPLPAKATILIHQFHPHHTASDGPSYVRTILGPPRWLLVYGDPATALENYDLLHSTDGGRRWTLINASPFVTAHHTTPQVFPESLGQPAMLLWPRPTGHRRKLPDPPTACCCTGPPTPDTPGRFKPSDPKTKSRAGPDPASPTTKDCSRSPSH